MPNAPALRVGRYQLFQVLASGGMASVHIARMFGTAGFARTVAIKRLHPHLARSHEFMSGFVDEARIASRIAHPNVVATLDVVADEDELFLVMEYVHGVSLSRLLKAAETESTPLPVPVVVAIIADVLYGLHAAHEAADEQGNPLWIVHRDVSPQNVLIGAEGIARVADFGIAKAASRLHSTRDGEIKGKLAYMAPEQINRDDVDRRADVYAAAVMFWEALTQRRLFKAPDSPAVIAAVLEGIVPPASRYNAQVLPEMDAVIRKAASKSKEDRFATALDFARAITKLVSPSPPHEVSEWVYNLDPDSLTESQRLLKEVEARSADAEFSEVRPMPAWLANDRRVAIAEAPTQMLEDTASVGVEAKSVERRESRPWTMFAFGISIALVVGVFAYAFGRKASDATGAVSADGVPAQPTNTADSGVRTDLASPAPAASASETPLADTTATASATPTAAPGRKATRSRTRDGRNDSARCSPAYIIDSNGFKRFKPECL